MRSKLWLILLTFVPVLIFSNLTYGQSDTSSNSGFELVINAHPNFYTLIVDEQFKSDIDVSTIVGFGSDISVGWIGNIWSVSVGIGYNNLKLKQVHRGLIFGSDIDPAVGIISTSTIDYNIDIDLLSIPLKVGYIMFQESLDLIIVLGVSWHYVLTDNSNVVLNYGNGTSVHGSSSFDAGSSITELCLGIRKRFPLSDRLNIMIEPSVHYYPKRHFTSDSRIKSLSINFGLSYILN